MLTVRRVGTENAAATCIAAVLGIVCCAALPLIGTLVGGIALAVFLGVAGGIVVLAALIASVVVVMRPRRRRLSPRAPRSRQP